MHKAQGQTSQITLVAAAPSMTRETAYTALSRGRLGNYLYLTPDPDTPAFAFTLRPDRPAGRISEGQAFA